MRRIELEVEFVTPCFLGGADNTTVAEWRAASIRGQLRWWFRAVMGGECAGALAEVTRSEAALFGTTNARSVVQVRTRSAPRASVAAGDSPRFGYGVTDQELAQAWADPAAAERLHLQHGAGNPISYLGFGCVNAHGVPVRPWLPPGETARLVIQTDSVSAWDLLSKPLWAWLNLGGIGSKSRRGFGSLRVRKVTGAPAGDDWLGAPGTLAEFEGSARRVLATAVKTTPAGGGPPSWSHFSPDAHVYVSSEGSASWQDAMVRAGGWLVAFRRRYGYPKDSRTLGGTPIANRDYVWAHADGQAPHPNVPDRAGFGLPLPFGRTASLTWGAGSEKRRGSPLLLHISQFGDKYYSVWTYLPADLVPRGEKLRFKADRSPAGAHPPSVEQKRIVGFFLDDLESKPKGLARRVL